ncbi:MAG TPA: hypothetical protein VFJ13_10860 [Paracoccaceae bacterium]|nr:hypothetical protein [Paracoccaceae bacterium]
MFKRLLPAALLVGAATGLAVAQTTPPTTTQAAPPATEKTVQDLRSGEVTVVYDQELSEEFEVSRDIIDRVEAEFGQSAVYDNGQQLPEGIDDAIAPGNMLPETAGVSEVPEQLGDLPTLGVGTHWVAVGEHLVEVTPENRIVMVLYDALP